MSNQHLTIVSKVFEGRAIRVVTVDSGEIMFIAADVCSVLEIDNVSQAIGRLDDDEKGITKVDTLGGSQDLLAVNESGLYALVIRSNKPQAKPFRKWVTSEVLPSIRRDGGYIDPGASKKQLKQLEARIRSKIVRNEFTDTLKAHGVTGVGYAMCTDAINEPLLGGTAKMVKKARGLVVRDNLRDHLSMNELSAIMLAEGVSQERIEVKQVTGNKPCADECGTVAQAIARAIK